MDTELVRGILSVAGTPLATPSQLTLQRPVLGFLLFPLQRALAAGNQIVQSLNLHVELVRKGET